MLMLLLLSLILLQIYKKNGIIISLSHLNFRAKNDSAYLLLLLLLFCKWKEK